MKICSVAPIRRESARTDGSHALSEKTYSLLRSDTEIVHKQIKHGTEKVEDLYYSYVWSRAANEIVEAIIEAEREGFDAAFVNTCMDVGVQQARAMVNIPVLGPGETTMTYATLLGSKFGVVTGPIPIVVETMTRHIKERGLEHRAI